MLWPSAKPNMSQPVCLLVVVRDVVVLRWPYDPRDISGGVPLAGLETLAETPTSHLLYRGLPFVSAFETGGYGFETSRTNVVNGRGVARHPHEARNILRCT